MIAIPALPEPFRFDPRYTALVMIDMQRDFIEPGGFGAALGNEVSLLAPVVDAAAALVAWCRARGIWGIHTKECHRPDLSDCPPAKRRRGKPSLRIGDPGVMGRILVDGEPGADFVPALAPAPGDLVVAPHDCYAGTWRLLNARRAKRQFEVRFVDQTDGGALAADQTVRMDC